MPFLLQEEYLQQRCILEENSLYLQHHCIYLKHLGRYKKILTALLLVIYVFIATPVSLWHHHKAHSSVASIAEKTIKAISKNATETNCSVCQHHYSSFDNDAIAYFPNLIRPIQSFNTFYSFYLLPNPAFSKPNKGPPFIG